MSEIKIRCLDGDATIVVRIADEQDEPRTLLRIRFDAAGESVCAFLGRQAAIRLRDLLEEAIAAKGPRRHARGGTR